MTDPLYTVTKTPDGYEVRGGAVAAFLVRISAEGISVGVTPTPPAPVVPPKPVVVTGLGAPVVGGTTS